MLALEVVSLDAALEALALARAGDGDLVALGEDVRLDFLSKFHVDRVDPELLQRLQVLGDPGLLQMAELWKGQLLFFRLTESHLNGVVAVLVRGLDLSDEYRPGLNDGNRNHLAPFREEVCHTNFCAQD